MKKFNPFKPIKIKPIKLHYNFDSDRDGVLDHRDCQPFNYWKQHSGPSEIDIDKENYLDIRDILTREAESKYLNGYDEMFFMAERAIDSFISRGKELIIEYEDIEGFRGTYNFRGERERQVPGVNVKVKWFAIPNFPYDVLEIYDPGRDVYVYGTVNAKDKTWKFVVAMTGLDKEKMKKKELTDLFNYIKKYGGQPYRR